ncbi:pyridoxine-pyridoxal-pyridoxamine kinase [Schizosaccharomyces japonicus yFS275]|uniref:pyridoxal kinase n=1 Tax=Schizosaccharomyces japonicus (strain yFS275 / FY16936) TaxID=402676 RepID=B6JV50_SCHJY|nr:pyridoxine-pyridoxal-pyridoxamine kinase [Schizosaccharomyces japonicus yFS275]EEB05251.1 pyridoxine-pyridoxal-pyridoxamine kinase [Schizosaccharomyces japonicus yFS275]
MFFQSAVCHGYAGNRAATFPLQLLGWDVDVLPTVHFSNHLAYGSTHGKVYSSEDVSSLLKGLENDSMGAYDAILTGYIPNENILDIVSEFAIAYKQRHPNTIWLMDPVMGDEGRMYVEDNVRNKYQQLLAMADIITPNAYEAQLLAGFPVEDMKSAKAAINAIHTRYHIPIVVITSFADSDDEEKLRCMASMKIGNSCQPFYFIFDYISGFFTGTGDLFASMLLAKTAHAVGDLFHKITELRSNDIQLSSDDKQRLRQGFESAVGQVLTSMHKVITNTKEYLDAQVSKDPSLLNNQFLLNNARELRIIQSQQEIQSYECSLPLYYADPEGVEEGLKGC